MRRKLVVIVSVGLLGFVLANAHCDGQEDVVSNYEITADASLAELVAGLESAEGDQDVHERTSEAIESPEQALERARELQEPQEHRRTEVTEEDGKKIIKTYVDNENKREETITEISEAADGSKTVTRTYTVRSSDSEQPIAETGFQPNDTTPLSRGGGFGGGMSGMGGGMGGGFGGGGAVGAAAGRAGARGGRAGRRGAGAVSATGGMGGGMIGSLFLRKYTGNFAYAENDLEKANELEEKSDELAGQYRETEDKVARDKLETELKAVLEKAKAAL